MDFDFSEPVDHVLERAGLCSNRSFNTFIRTHKVEIIYGTSSEKQQVTSRKFTLNSAEDSVFVDGKKLEVPEHLYVLLNKPLDVVCSRVSDRHKTVFGFLPSEIKNHPLYECLHVAGRLDSDSHGLVLLTTNGKFSASLVNPETHVEKTYEVKLRNEPGEEDRQRYAESFKKGFLVPAEKKGEAFFSKPAGLLFSDGVIAVKISEGKFHQVRRMFRALGNEVIDLKRIAIGEIRLPKELEEGGVKNLSLRDFYEV